MKIKEYVGVLKSERAPENQRDNVIKKLKRMCQLLRMSKNPNPNILDFIEHYNQLYQVISSRFPELIADIESARDAVKDIGIYMKIISKIKELQKYDVLEYFSELEYLINCYELSPKDVMKKIDVQMTNFGISCGSSDIRIRVSDNYYKMPRIAFMLLRILEKFTGMIFVETDDPLNDYLKNFPEPEEELRGRAKCRVRFKAVVTIDVCQYSLDKVTIETPRNVVSEFYRRVSEKVRLYYRGYEKILQEIKKIVFEDLKDYIELKDGGEVHD